MKYVFILLLMSFSLSGAEKHFILNTSNSGKQKEFQALFLKEGLGVDFSSYDLDEIDASPLQVVIHKASQMQDRVIVEDTSLDVEGASVGINVKYLLTHLDMYVEKKACWNVYLAFKEADRVFVFEGKVHGKIVASKGGGGFGFDPYFQPQGSGQTLAEWKPDNFNARALAVHALIQNKPCHIGPTLKDWNGPWQQNTH